MDNEQKTVEQQKPKSIWTYIIDITSIILVVFHVYTTLFGMLPDVKQRSIHLGLALVLCYLRPRVSKKDPEKKAKIPVWDILFAAVALISCLYILVNYSKIINVPFLTISPLDTPLGIILILLILEGSRRTVGWTFTIMSGAMILYALFGGHIPGTWGHRGYSVTQIVQILYHSTLGLWGEMLGISAGILAVFSIFGGTLIATGAGETFIRLANRLMGKARGGPAKVAVVASALTGTVSGSAVSNVVTTGTFTIPTMMRSGYDPAFAGAVEAVASTGGQIMPPIMGAGAFVMAQLLGVPYWTIVKAAIVPALLYYGGVFIAVHLKAKQLDLRPSEEKEKISFISAAHLLIPLLSMVVLIALGYMPGYVAMLCSGLVIFLSIILRVFKNFKEFAVMLLELCRSTGSTIADIACLLGSAQILVCMISMTGLGVKFSNLVMSAAGNNIALSLVIAAVVVTILGMGMPTSAAYVLGASVLAPALIQIGLPALSAHLFIFYFAALGPITPPVCGAVFLASGLSGAPWLKTARHAILLALPIYFVPFAFILSSALLLDGTPFDVVFAIITAIIGAAGIAVATIGHLETDIVWWRRIIIFAASVILIFPAVWINLICLVVLAAALLPEFRSYINGTRTSAQGNA